MLRLLAGANFNMSLWYSCNESKLGKLLFSVPDVLRTTLNADVETDGAAVLEDNKIIVRKPDGSLMFAHVVGEDVPALEIGSKVKDTLGLAMKLAARHFSLLDVDHDGTPDMIMGGNACRVLFSALGIPVSAPCKGQETRPHCAP